MFRHGKCSGLEFGELLEPSKKSDFGSRISEEKYAALGFFKQRCTEEARRYTEFFLTTKDIKATTCPVKRESFTKKIERVGRFFYIILAYELGQDGGRTLSSWRWVI